MLIPVAGTVTFDGKPLNQGSITFVSDVAGGSSAAGPISATGTYSLATTLPGDGAAPGSYKVRIESWASPPQMSEKGVDPGKPAIPEKYFDTQKSGLTAVVKPGNSPQTIDFNLTP